MVQEQPLLVSKLAQVLTAIAITGTSSPGSVVLQEALLRGVVAMTVTTTTTAVRRAALLPGPETVVTVDTIAVTEVVTAITEEDITTTVALPHHLAPLRGTRPLPPVLQVLQVLPAVTVATRAFPDMVGTELLQACLSNLRPRLLVALLLRVLTPVVSRHLSSSMRTHRLRPRRRALPLLPRPATSRRRRHLPVVERSE